MKRSPTISITASLLVLCAAVFLAKAQAMDDANLTRTIHQLDQGMFDAFNKCADSAELSKHESYFAPDVEFYHDNGGVTWTRDAMLANTKQYACGKYTRKLVEASFKVSPVKDFGAISTGVHRFCDSDTKACAGEAEFVMIWRNTKSKWEVTRSLSFGHREASAAGIDPADVDKIIKKNPVTSASFVLIENGQPSFSSE